MPWMNGLFLMLECVKNLIWLNLCRNLVLFCPICLYVNCFVQIKKMKLKWGLCLCLLLIANSVWHLRLFGFLFLSTNIPIFWVHHQVRLRCHCDVVLYFFSFLLSLFPSIGINPFLNLLNATACFMRNCHPYLPLLLWTEILEFDVNFFVLILLFD